MANSTVRLDFTRIYPGAKIGDDTRIGPFSLIGLPPRESREGELKLVIGSNGIVRPFTTIYAGSVIGDHFQTGQGVSIREDNLIGDYVSIGTNTVLEFGNRIGNRVRIHTGCFLEMVTIEDDVFVGPYVVFTDDPHPMNCPKYKGCKGGATVKDLARIGANATILPGVVVGRNSLVGAGSVVTENVPDNTVVVGNPAQVVKHINDLECSLGAFERPYLWEPYLADSSS
ncbi:MAG: transferase [Actinobacteria bacterium]|nr:transferase [Actinomycetota bacterium]